MRVNVYVDGCNFYYSLTQSSGRSLAKLKRGCRNYIILIAMLCGSSSLVPSRRATAQGIATAAIRGSVRAENGANVDGARVRVINSATGVASQAMVRGGRFLVQGMEVGGPYIVEVRHLGFVPQKSAPLRLALGEPPDIQFVMQRTAVRLEPVLVSTAASLPAGGGTATLIPASLVQRLPTLDRNFYDFVRLAPQVSTKVGSQRTGVSAAGANFRFNNFLINGADERFVNGNVSAAANVGKSIPMDAVKEFQVLVAPYDVRYGDFAGALVNTVTQSGTNELRGSIFTLWRSDRLARGGDLASSVPYDRMQYGLSLGGPLVRDRIHFFVAPELQRFTSPAAGPYVGQPSSRDPPVPVVEPDLQRLDGIMRAYGLSAGSPGLVRTNNPLRNVFTRLDAAIPEWNSRVLAFVNYVGAEDPRFSRSSAADTFSLSSYQHSAATGVRLASLQWHTDLPRSSGGHNELTISQLSDWVDFLPEVRQPIVRVHVLGTGGSLVALNTGTHEQAQGRLDRSWSMTVRDELSLPMGARHVLVLGAQVERFNVKRGGVTGGYGTWTFSSLDSLEQGIAERFELRKDLGSADAPLPGLQYAAYVGDEWRPSSRVSITSGLRMDVTDLRARAPFNAEVYSLFGRRTDEMPRERVHVSPRLGFSWDLSGTGRHNLRGGVGVFTGRPPRAWLRPAITNYGVGIGQLKCGQLADDQGTPPPFVADYRDAPTACANGQGLVSAPLGDVDLLDRNLRMAQSLRGSLAYDRRLPWGVTATTEALVSRNLSDFMFVNLNLKGPQATDRFGRVLYGTISASGVPTPAQRSGFNGVIDLVNTSKNYSYQISTRLERRLAGGTAASASYTFSRTRDVQSPSRVNMAGTAMWGDARAVSGRHDDLTPGISLNDLPHRVVVAFTYEAPWQRWGTDVSLYYVGESGSPFTYVAWGTGKRLGDLNADGSNANDPIYIPRDAGVAAEIRFSGLSDAPGADNSSAAQAQRVLRQQAAFERLIEQAPCLRHQRGRILDRNSCREPFSHTTIAAVRQEIPVGRYRPEVGLEIFNLLNLLHGDWGRYRVAAPRLLEQVPAQGAAQPLFRFNAAQPRWTTLHTASAFQLQLGVRYRF